MKELVKYNVNIIPIMSYNAFKTDTKYRKASEFVEEIEEITNHKVVHTIKDLESVDFNIRPHKIADISNRLMAEINMHHVQSQRFSNFEYLLQNIKSSNVELLCNDMNRVTTAPLYFIIYTKNRKEIQSKLCNEHIYAPIIWPVYYKEVLVDDTTNEIYNETLAIPIDQRYDIGDMARIVTILNQC